ncbi:hypothetical protein PLICBS_010135 [Purpureocillium lilacinum]|uniref:uncharacterized protein n=1 Tax=Purpureocillium lilacinum TaxID=33203 RepID=UPI002084C357|nr:hypothetical protein PLICBS_010135 [Purpureocillium lilacinum]
MADSHGDIWVQLATAASERPRISHGTVDEMKKQMLDAPPFGTEISRATSLLDPWTVISVDPQQYGRNKESIERIFPKHDFEPENKCIVIRMPSPIHESFLKNFERTVEGAIQRIVDGGGDAGDFASGITNTKEWIFWKLDGWFRICTSAGQFDNRLKKIIGTFILVTFKSNNTKEVGTNHYQSAWHYGKPTFFQVQFRAPYFSPPQDSRYLHLGAVCKGPDLPGGRPPDAAPRVLAADQFQERERAVHQDWVRLMDPDIESASEAERTKRCHRALRHMILWAGPSWGSDKNVDHVVPWRRGKDNFFRLPIEATKSVRESGDDLLCEPTILLPTRHNIMTLARRIETFSGLSAEVKQMVTWIKRRLNNGGKHMTCAPTWRQGRRRRR